MSLKLRRGLEADRTSITPEVGEPIYTTDTQKLYIGDGTTPGGIEVSGSGAQALSGLTDVDLTSVIDGQVLVYSGGQWENQANPAGVTDHGLLTGLSDNDHPQYALTGSSVEFTTLTLDRIAFDTTYTAATTPEGELNWNSDDGTLAVGLPGGTSTLQIGQELLVRVRNTTGTLIPNGTVVKQIGSQGTRPLISAATAADSPLVGGLAIATEDIAHNANGYCTFVGLVRNLDTSSYSAGTNLYLASGTSGAFTDTEPNAPNKRMWLGIVINQNATTGSIYFRPECSHGLGDLFDVNGTTPDSTNKYLVWDDTNEYWDANQIYFSGVSSTGHSHTIDDITDYPEVTYTNTTFVSKGGNDSTGDGTIEYPYLTIQKGIDESSSGDTVYIFGGGEFSEGITGSTDINIYAPNVDLVLNDGTQLIVAKGNYTFDKITRNSGSGNMIISSGVSGYANVKASELRDNGSGSTILNLAGGILDLNIDQVYAGNGGYGAVLENNETGFHVHFNADDLYLSSPNAVGIQLNSGGTVLSRIQHIKEISDGTGTSTCFIVNDGDLNLRCDDLQATTLGTIGDDGNVNLNSQQSVSSNGVINTGSGTYQAFLLQNGGSTNITSDLQMQLSAPSYKLDGLSGNSGSILSVGTGGLLVPTTLNVGSEEWQDTTEAVTALTTTSETTIYEVTNDQEVDAGSVEYELNIDNDYYRTTTARLYCGNTIWSTDQYEGAGLATLSDALPITGTIATNTTWQVTLQTTVAPGDPQNTTIIDGDLTLRKSGVEATATWGSITGNITGQTDLYTEFLAKDNADAFTPTGDYNPATKKYVDDSISGATGSFTAGTQVVTVVDGIITDISLA